MIFTLPDNLNEPMWLGDFFEYSNLIWVAIFFVHCLYYRGKWDTLKIFLIGMLYGLFLENSGVIFVPPISAGFFYEQNYHFYLFEFFGVGIRISQVPFATHLGWCNIFYISLTFWEKIAEAFPKIRKNIVLGGTIMAASGLLLDLQLDIVASQFYWWVWNTAYKPLWFGVPLNNYIAWFTAVGIFGAFWVWHHEYHKDWTQKKSTWRLFWLMPIIIAVDGVLFFAIQGLLGWAGLIWSGYPIF